MSEFRGSPALTAFIRSFNLRRRAAVASNAALAAVVALTYLRIVEPSSRLAYWMWGAGVSAYVLANWLFAKCPECRRWIGVTPNRLRELPRGFRCELELASGDELDGVWD